MAKRENMCHVRDKLNPICITILYILCIVNYTTYITVVIFFGISNGLLTADCFVCWQVLKLKFKESFDCFEAIFGGGLDAMIDSASIIVLERYYESSSLESHRVDPLLLKGKVIVSTPSFGKPLYD